MLWIARGVTLTFARQVVAQATAQGARASVKPLQGILAEIWVRESDRELVAAIILSFRNDAQGGTNESRSGVHQTIIAAD